MYTNVISSAYRYRESRMERNSSLRVLPAPLMLLLCISALLDDGWSEESRLKRWRGIQVQRRWAGAVYPQWESPSDDPITPSLFTLGKSQQCGPWVRTILIVPFLVTFEISIARAKDHRLAMNRESSWSFLLCFFLFLFSLLLANNCSDWAYARLQ